MDVAITPPVPRGLSRELFHQMLLSSPHFEEENLGTPLLSFTLLADYFIGLMRIPYLYIEVKRIQNLLAEGRTLKNNVELRYQALSTLSNSLEIFLWFYEKKWVALSRRKGKQLQTVALLMRGALYEQAVRKQSRAFIECQRIKKVHPAMTKSREYKHLKVSLISHIAFFGWALLGLIGRIQGVPYPRPFIKMLHFTSVSFGLIASGYDQDSDISRFFKRISKRMPSGYIY